MDDMTQQEAMVVVRMCGWTPRLRTVKRHTASYLYAYKKIQGVQREKYIASVARLETMVVDDIVAKLGSLGATAEN